MDQPTHAVTILSRVSPEDAAAIGALLPHLSDRFSGEPVSQDMLQALIDSPHHDQLVARNEHDIIVGIATVSETIGIAAGRSVWLEDFVVSPETRGTGVGGMLWDGILEWGHTRGATKLCFTSRATRTAAHTFYIQRGATIRDTSFFTKHIV